MNFKTIVVPFMFMAAFLFAGSAMAQTTTIKNVTQCDMYYSISIYNSSTNQWAGTAVTGVGTMSSNTYTPPAGWEVVWVRVYSFFAPSGTTGTVGPTSTTATVTTCTSQGQALWTSYGSTQADVVITP